MLNVNKVLVHPSQRAAFWATEQGEDWDINIGLMNCAQQSCLRNSDFKKKLWSQRKVNQPLLIWTLSSCLMKGSSIIKLSCRLELLALLIDFFFLVCKNQDWMNHLKQKSINDNVILYSMQVFPISGSSRAVGCWLTWNFYSTLERSAVGDVHLHMLHSSLHQKKGTSCARVVHSYDVILIALKVSWE